MVARTGVQAGLMTRDEVLATAAAARLRLVRTDRWPMVAAHLLAADLDGQALVALAGLSPSASGWDVDPLVPAVLAELGAAELDVDTAGDVVARLLAQVRHGGDHYVVRTLAGLAPDLDYPGGVIGEVSQMAEWLDCECHAGSLERAEADVLEHNLRQLPALQLDAGLLDALTGANPTRV